MDRKEIRAFIDGWVHDFETIRCLQQFDRNKETLPVADHICSRLELFHQKISESSDDLKGIMEQDFWARPFPPDGKVSDVRAQVREFAVKWPEIMENDLKKIRYGYFLELLESWVLKNISKLEKRIKTNAQRAIEKGLLAALCCILCAGVLFFMVSKILDVTLRRDWGLKGTFYSGQKFETLIGTGAAKAINFSGPRKMNKVLPKTNYSVRWQGQLLIPKDGKYAFVIDAKDRAELFLAPSLFQPDDLNLSSFRKAIQNNDSFKFQVGEFSGSVNGMKRLLASLGKTPEEFEGITSAVRWLNKSVEPFQNYIKHLLANAPEDPLIKKILPDNFLNMSEADLKALALTSRGAEIKRVILTKLYQGQVPKRRQNRAGDLVLRELLGVSSEDDIDKLSEQDFTKALNEVLKMREFLVRVRNSFDPNLFDKEMRRILSKASRKDVHLNDVELLLLNRALLGAIYPQVIKKNFCGLVLSGRRGERKGVSQKVLLKKGVYPVLIEHVQTGGDSFLKFYWKSDGRRAQIVPSRYLRFAVK